jgi:hypothetical protein
MFSFGCKQLLFRAPRANTFIPFFSHRFFASLASDAVMTKLKSSYE